MVLDYNERSACVPTDRKERVCHRLAAVLLVPGVELTAQRHPLLKWPVDESLRLHPKPAFFLRKRAHREA